MPPQTWFRDLTTESFIACLRRFIAKPTLIWSDHGTNFVGANRVLKESPEGISPKTNQTIKQYKQYTGLNVHLTLEVCGKNTGLNSRPGHHPWSSQNVLRRCLFVISSHFVSIPSGSTLVLVVLVVFSCVQWPHIVETSAAYRPKMDGMYKRPVTKSHWYWHYRPHYRPLIIGHPASTFKCSIIFVPSVSWCQWGWSVNEGGGWSVPQNSVTGFPTFSSPLPTISCAILLYFILLPR